MCQRNTRVAQAKYVTLTKTHSTIPCIPLNLPSVRFEGRDTYALKTVIVNLINNQVQANYS